MEEISIQHELVSKLSSAFVTKQDEVIKKAIADAGFDPEDKAFITANITRVQYAGDKFDHFYYHFGKPDQLRIISIQRSPDVNLGISLGEPFKQLLSAKYY